MYVLEMNFCACVGEHLHRCEVHQNGAGEREGAAYHGVDEHESGLRYGSFARVNLSPNTAA
jgi:hypothetical protein